jgi:hypothetical protein
VSGDPPVKVDPQLICKALLAGYTPVLALLKVSRTVLILASIAVDAV